MTLDEFKKQGKFTDDQIAKLTRLSRGTINRWRNGHVKRWPKYLAECGLNDITRKLHAAAKMQNI